MGCWQEAPAPAGSLEAAAEQDDEPEKERRLDDARKHVRCHDAIEESNVDHGGTEKQGDREREGKGVVP